MPVPGTTLQGTPIEATAMLGNVTLLQHPELPRPLCCGDWLRRLLAATPYNSVFFSFTRGGLACENAAGLAIPSSQDLFA